MVWMLAIIGFDLQQRNGGQVTLPYIKVTTLRIDNIVTPFGRAAGHTIGNEIVCDKITGHTKVRSRSERIIIIQILKPDQGTGIRVLHANLSHSSYHMLVIVGKVNMASHGFNIQIRNMLTYPFYVKH